jgi:MOSC domain-containing protein YiiM
MSVEPLARPVEAPAWTGQVVGIFIAPAAADPMRSLDQVLAVAGKGLEGDRYFSQEGSWSDRPGTGREVTLIESEAVADAGSEYGFELPPGVARRNIVTAGVALNHLVGQEFLVGEVRLRGMRLCEPCAHLSELTGVPLIKALVHRGGLRAEIVDGGSIRVGDNVRPVTD